MSSEAIGHMVSEYRLSERHACSLVGLSRDERSMLSCASKSCIPRTSGGAGVTE